MKPLPKRKMLDLASVQDFHDDTTRAIEDGLKEGLLHAGVIRDLELSGTPVAVQHDLGRMARTALVLGASVPATVSLAPHALDPFRYVMVTASAAQSTINVQGADVANTVLLAVAPLHSYTLRAGLLAVDGDSIEVEHVFSAVSDIDPAAVGTTFGAATLAFTPAVAQSGGDVLIRSRIYRVSPTVQRCVSTTHSSVAAWPDDAQFTAAAETLSTAVTVGAVGYAEASGVVTCRLSSITFRPAGTGISARVLIA